MNDGRTIRVGFIIGRQLRELRLLHPDRPGGGGLGLMRFAWVADRVNRDPERGLRYELYRPWRRYDVLIFMKAMGPACMRLLHRARRRGVRTIFDANVNYYEAQGRFHYAGMRPTATQQRDAVAITRAADAVIADSEFLERMCRAYNPRTVWIPDNVNMDLVPSAGVWTWNRHAELPLLWSGQAGKLFELLAIEDVLRRYRHRIRLRLVTNDLGAMDTWYGDAKRRFRALLDAVPHEIIRFESIEQLLGIYAAGGVAISPRLLDNSYNLGHTEWKITLGMAAGCVALCSPVPSYLGVAERARGRGIRVCASPEQWTGAFEDLFAGRLDLVAEGAAARRVVDAFYATPVVAGRHAAFVTEVANREGSPP